ncbi:unnamed protein product [Diamesa serratosioi]
MSPRGDFKVLDNALEKLYNKNDDASENIRQLFHDAANTNKYRDLKIIISDWIGSRVTKETVLATIILAEEHNDMNLKIKALSFIQNNIDVLVCKKWEDLHKFKKLKDEIYKSLLVSLFQKNKALSEKVLDIETDLDKTEEYELLIKRVFRDEKLQQEEHLHVKPPIGKSSVNEISIEELPTEEYLIEEPSIEEPTINELLIEELPIEEYLTEESPSLEEYLIKESPAIELSIEEPSTEEALIEKLSIDKFSVEELPIEEYLIEESPSFEEYLNKESPSIELSIEEPSTEEALIEKLSINKYSLVEEANEDLQSTNSKGLTVAATTEEMPLENKIPEDVTPVTKSVMNNIGVLDHIDESVFESYMRTQRSANKLEQTNTKRPFSFVKNDSNEDLYTSFKTHFVPVKKTRLLYIKKIDVNSIEKHAFKNTTDSVEQQDDVPKTETEIEKIKLYLKMVFETHHPEGSPILESPKFDMKLAKSGTNSSQSLCSDLSELLLNTCSHNLVTTCNICIENAEIENKREKDEIKIMDLNDLPPNNMFLKSKTNMKKDKNAILSWVEKTTHLTEENRNIKQKLDFLEVKMELGKEKWHEQEKRIVPQRNYNIEQLFDSKLESAFMDLVTVKMESSRRLPVKLEAMVAHNSFQQLKQAAERRFEILHMLDKDIPNVVPEVPEVTTVVVSTPKVTTPPIVPVSKEKFYPQNNKNVKFFKSNQNAYSAQRRKKNSGHQNNIYLC